MRRSFPVFLFIVLALLLASSFASSAVNAAATQPSESAGVTSASRASVPAERGEQIARDHLLANAALYGASPADFTGLRVNTNHDDNFTGVRIVKFVQTVNGIQVFGGEMNVSILPSGEILHVGNRAVPNLAQSVNSASPTLTQEAAIAAAANALGLAYTPSTVTQTDSLGGAEREIRFAGGDLSLETIPVLLAYQPMADGSLRLSWDLNIYQQDAQHWWDVRVDALTGELLDKNDWVVSENWDALLNDPYQVPTGAVPGKLETITTFADTIVTPFAPTVVGSYRVYGIPLESPSHGARTLVANPDNATASPFGWHDTNGAAGAEFTTTQGNNAHAYTDVDANNSPDAGSSPDGGAGLVFDFPLDLALPPSGYRPAAVTNLFYWNNLMHDIPYLYGFDEEARNFQENNYGNGGAASDYVNAEAQDGSGTNNANFATGADGTNPRMQMYIWTAPNPDRDGDIDNGIIAHEYGHGISNRLTGTGSGCLNNSEQMGEGWSDWQSVILTMRTGDTATTNRGVGTYALNQPITGQGIRPAPYNTNFAVNNYTYSNLPSMAVPHGVGFVWNTMLWEMNWELIAFHGFNPDIYDFTAMDDGNTLAYKLVTLGMDLQPCRPGFVDGRDAILAADVAVSGGANACRIWAAFARRGLGASASQGTNTSTTDGTAAFDLPAQCSGGPTPTPTASPTPGSGNRFCSTSAIPIPDANPTGATGTISVPSSATISDLNVVVTGTHSWVGDIVLNLSNGTTNVTFYDQPGVPASTFGCSGDNLPGVVADDEGVSGSFENSCQNATPAFIPGGSYTNNAPLSAFDGANTSGTWTLTAADLAAGDTGTITGWCVEFAGGAGPTATPTTPPTAPDINVTPAAFEETHSSPPQTTNDTMNVQNVGSGTLTWTITEDDSRPGKLMTAKGAYVYNGAVQNVSGLSGSGAPAGTIEHSPAIANGSLFITHSATQNITTGNSVSCNAGGLHTDNSYYRVYDLAGDFGITQTIEVDEVSFGVEQAVGATGSQPVTINLYTLVGPLNTANLTLIGSEAASVPDSASGTVYAVPVSPEVVVPAGSVLVVEVFTPNGQTTGNSFFIGSNADPETDPSYLRAADCGVAQPTATGAIGFPNMHIVMNVSAGIVGGGACTAPTDIPWLTVAPMNGSTSGGGSTPVTLTYNSASLATGTYTGTLCIASNDADEALVTVPITLNVGPPTAIDLSSFTSPMSGINPADLAAAGLLLLAGAVLVLRRK